MIFETPLVAGNYVDVSKICQDNVPRITRSFFCSNVRVGGWKSFTIRNSLWPTPLIPMNKTGNYHTIGTRRKEPNFAGGSESFKNGADESNLFLCHRFYEALSAYILFNDEDDGFRITWITAHQSSPYTQESKMRSHAYGRPPHGIQPMRPDILVKSDESAWEMCLSDSTTGNRSCDGHEFQTNDGSKMNIAFEAYLRIDALLSDILDRRSSSLFKKSPYQNENVRFMPDFFYNLVSVSIDGLGVVVVIVFSNNEKMLQSTKKIPSSLGVFISFNLFDQSYDELKWYSHPSCNDASSMKQWCNSLALNWRMKECHVGVFCLSPSKIGPQLDNWISGTHECNVDEDLRDDCNVELWSEYVEQGQLFNRKGTIVAPKDVAMSSLYPYCDVVTNRAVHNAIPVKRMVSRHSPLELIYG